MNPARNPDARRTRRATPAAPWWAWALLALCVLALLTPQPATAQQPGPGDSTPWLESRFVFTLSNLTLKAAPDEYGYLDADNDTWEVNEQNARLQLTGRPASWLDWRVDYLNVKQNGTAPWASPLGFFLAGLGLGLPPLEAQGGGAAQHRRESWRRWIEKPGASQNLSWYHEVDQAYLRLALGPVEAVLGRQPIGWGSGRFWRPTDLFAPFSPHALDTEFKPGVDAVLLNAFPGDFSRLSAVYVAAPLPEPAARGSSILRWRGPLAGESEASLLGGSLRGAQVGGLSLEGTLFDAGWRVESLGFRERQPGSAGSWDPVQHFTVLGMDYGFAGGQVGAVEWYHHSQGATTTGEVNDVFLGGAYQQGRQPHLSRNVLGLALSTSFWGLWELSYSGLASALRDPANTSRWSTMQRLTLRYSIADEAEALFSLGASSGAGLTRDPLRPLQSEFGHVPGTLLASIKFVL